MLVFGGVGKCGCRTFAWKATVGESSVFGCLLILFSSEDRVNERFDCFERDAA